MYSEALRLWIVGIIGRWEATESSNIIILSVEESDYLSRYRFRLSESFRPGWYLEKFCSDPDTIGSRWSVSSIGYLWPLFLEVFPDILSILEYVDLRTDKSGDRCITGESSIDVRADVYHELLVISFESLEKGSFKGFGEFFLNLRIFYGFL